VGPKHYKSKIWQKEPECEKERVKEETKKKKPNVNQQKQRITHRDPYFMCLPLHITQ
jgi:hypothetical protein